MIWTPSFCCSFPSLLERNTPRPLQNWSRVSCALHTWGDHYRQLRGILIGLQAASKLRYDSSTIFYGLGHLPAILFLSLFLLSNSKPPFLILEPCWTRWMLTSRSFFFFTVEEAQFLLQFFCGRVIVESVWHNISRNTLFPPSFEDFNEQVLSVFGGCDKK